MGQVSETIQHPFKMNKINVLLMFISLMNVGCTIPYWIKYDYIMSEAEVTCFNRVMLSHPDAYEMNFNLGTEVQYNDSYNGEDLSLSLKIKGQNLTFYVKWSNLSYGFNGHISSDSNMDDFYMFYLKKIKDKFKLCSLDVKKVKCQKRLPPNVRLNHCSDV